MGTPVAPSDAPKKSRKNQKRKPLRHFALEDAPLDPVSPLAAAAAREALRLRPPKPVPEIPSLPKKRGRPPRLVSPDLVIGMKAAGVPQTRIAEALGVATTTVASALATIPDYRERISDLRDKLKWTKMEKAHEVEGRMWERLSKEVDKGDAKDVDAMARALLASEKIQAAASGEAHASGSVAPPPTAPDIKILINALLNP